MIGFKANRIREVAAGSLPANLRWLILTDNRIEALPTELGNCRQLQKLMLAGNRLQALPASLAACTRLELLRIAANRLSEFPDVLLALPRLSWLAYAGNPFCAAHELSALAGTAIAEIDWNELHIGQPLGEGASGVIHQAEHRHADGGRAVAVKRFKGALTSDGLPRSEMAACIAAGEHAHLIPALGKVKGHPAACDALVMPLIDPGFCNLAEPPSFESCTRDVYAAELSFAADSLLEIARGIASAARHLHRRGIMHGDLYGHNILHCGHGQPRVLLGDFGAASFFTPGTAHAHALQRLEVRAFGVLLAELLERCELTADTAVTATSRHVVARLSDLKTACLDDETARRPLFDEIERVLASLAR